ncbi:MAG: SAM-dependent methyltransferase [Caldilineaceae bacterium]|nr:SAM-dependent methyltransferase [Caldilineaceae bacterium]
MATDLYIHSNYSTGTQTPEGAKFIMSNQIRESIDTTGAARTGSGPTFLVAMEQYEPPAQRIIHDDLAAKVLPGGERFFLKLLRFSPLRNWMLNYTEKEIEGGTSAFLCRKRYIDETIVKAVEDGTVAAIVNLGAAFDTRVYRLPALANVPAWELDQPGNIEAKQKGIMNALGTIPSHVTLVPINFITQDLGEVLQQHGYAGDQKTFFIWEAVSQYLTETAVRQTFNFLAQAPTGSQLTFTYVLKDFIEGKNRYGQEKFHERMVVKDKIWHFGFDPAEVGDFLGEYGWRLVEDLSYEELNNRYAKSIGRNLPSMKIEQMVWAEKL